jgi:excisionase family DNA binding protein
MPTMTAAPVKMLTIEEVAELLHVEPRTVRAWCQRGELEYVKFGRKTLRFKPEWLDDLIERKQRAG